MSQTDFLTTISEFVVEWGGKPPSAVLAHGIQAAADRIHTLVCPCAGIRWIDCKDPEIKTDIKRLFEIEQWETIPGTGDPFNWTETFPAGYVTVTRLTEPIR